MPTTEHDALGRRTTPVRIAVVPEPDESLPGLVARAVAENVLLQTRILLAGADGLLHPGTIGSMPTEDLRRLAAVLGCGEEAILARAHPYDEPGRGRGKGRGRGRVDFGGVPVLREDLLLERRRISPLTLAGSAHHRAWWLLGLLPYCPVSGERLVERCPDCPEEPRRALGWRRSRGIGVCERCGRPVPPSAEPPLPERLGKGYWLFAGLLCIDAEVRARAVARLPERVRLLDPAARIDLTLQLGAACRSKPITLARSGFVRLPPAILAEVVATGADLLRRWPDGLREWCSEELAAAGDDADRIGRVRRTLRRPGLPHTAAPTQMGIWREALPNLFATFPRSSGDPRPTVLAGQTSRTTGLSFDQLEALEAAGALDVVMEYRRKRRFRQYRLDQVLGVKNALAGCAPASRAEWRLGLPAYAVEQLCCEGVLELAGHPAVAVVRTGLQLATAGLENLETRLAAAARSGTPPPGSVALGTAARRIGGRLKPWSAIIRALLDGSVPFRLSGAGPFARRARVRPEALAAFAAVAFDEGAHPGFDFSSELMQRDTAEILNVDAPEMAAIRRAGKLAFRGEGTALRTDRAVVLALAREMVLGGRTRCRSGGQAEQSRNETGPERDDARGEGLAQAPHSGADAAMAAD